MSWPVESSENNSCTAAPVPTRPYVDSFTNVEIGSFCVFFSLRHFSLLFDTFWGKNLCWIWSCNLWFALFIHFSRRLHGLVKCRTKPLESLAKKRIFSCMSQFCHGIHRFVWFFSPIAFIDLPMIFIDYFIVFTEFYMVSIDFSLVSIHFSSTTCTCWTFRNTTY